MVSRDSAGSRGQTDGGEYEMRAIDRVIDALNRANLSFGFREAVILSLVGVAIASIVAYNQVG